MRTPRTGTCARCGQPADQTNLCPSCAATLADGMFEKIEQAEARHGGARPGAGRKSSWQTPGPTVTIRVPEQLAAQVLELARQLDQGDDTGEGLAQRMRDAAAILRDHLEDVGRKGTVKRSEVRRALDLLDL